VWPVVFRFIVRSLASENLLGCCQVDRRFRQRGQFLISFFFFLKGSLKELCPFFVTNQFSVGASRSITGDLVVFDALRG
jgi:hypothetical protein